jgi:hypothetical protein
MQQDFTITLDHVDEYIREEARKAVNKYFDFLQKTVSSYPLGDTELGGKAKDCAEKSITMTRDYMHKLSRAKASKLAYAELRRGAGRRLSQHTLLARRLPLCPASHRSAPHTIILTSLLPATWDQPPA